MMKQYILYITAVLLCVACSKDDTTPPSIGPARRTVIVYMSGENNLSRYVNNDLNEMVNGRKLVGDDEHLVVYVDRASTQEKPFIARITRDAKQPLDTLYKYESDHLSSNAAVMTDVLQRIVTLCPATEDYGLVLWGHANGWIIEQESKTAASNKAHRAYGIDSGDNTAELKGLWMNIPTMRQAFEQVPVRWKFIFADCCNMLNVETAYELRKHADYLIGSPAEITGDGAPYTTVVQDLFNHDDVAMYSQLCEHYYAQTDLVGGHTPLATVDLKKIDKLAEATHQILPTVSSYLPLEDATKGLIYYYSYDREQEAEKIHYDMKDMVRAALEYQPGAYQEWLEVYNSTVLSQKVSTRWHAQCVNFLDFTVTPEKMGCMSMFFPMEKYEHTSHPYNTDIKKMQWYQAVGWSTVGW